jgi:hypothetical protein
MGGVAAKHEDLNKDSSGVSAKRIYEPDTQLRPGTTTLVPLLLPVDLYSLRSLGSVLLAGKRHTVGLVDTADHNESKHASSSGSGAAAAPAAADSGLSFFSKPLFSSNSSEALFASPSGLCVDRGTKLGGEQQKNSTALPVMHAPRLLIADLKNARVRVLDRTGLCLSSLLPCYVSCLADSMYVCLPLFLLAGCVSSLAAPAAAAPAPAPPGGDSETKAQASSASSAPALASAPAASAPVPASATSVNRFQQPLSVAVDSQSNVYVCDVAAHTIFKVSAATGEVTPFLGGAAAQANYSSPLWYPTAGM